MDPDAVAVKSADLVAVRELTVVQSSRCFIVGDCRLSGKKRNFPAIYTKNGASRNVIILCVSVYICKLGEVLRHCRY